MSRKSFTVDEANALIPGLVRTFHEIELHKHRIRETAKRIEVLELLWGDALRDPKNPDHDEFTTHRANVDRDLRAIQRCLDGEILARGLRLPAGGIEEGLVDFPSTYRGRWVYLCWQKEERQIGYYHETDGGFLGRRRITPSDRAEMGRDDPSTIDDSELDF
jgi:hypothetical protein